MCCCGPCCSIFASIFTIVQTTLHLMCCIWMILVNACSATAVNNVLMEVLYFTYFYRESCTAFNISIISTLDVNENKNLTINNFYNIPTTSDKAEMTYSFAVALTTLDITWMVSSVVLIVGMCVQSSGWRYKIFHLPWLICCFTACVTDAVATVIYGRHALETNTIEKWLQFIGAVEKPDVDISVYIDTTSVDGSFLMIPSLAMALIFSRFLIFWFINVILFLSLLCSVCRSRPDRRGRIHAPPPPAQYSLPSNNVAPRIPPSYKIEEEEVQQQQGNVYSRVPVYPGHNLPNNSFKKPVPTVNPKTSSTEDPDSNEARIKRWQLYYGADAFDLRVKQPRSSVSNNPPPPPPAPQKDEPIQRSSYGEDALRSQLPWSYFRNRSDTGRLRPSTPDIMPPVPVPDYNIQFGGHRERRKF